MARRVIKATPEAEAAVEVGERACRMLGSPGAGFYTDESGAYIIGAISLLAQPEQIRVGGAFTFPRGNDARLPSTAVNPQPILLDNSPVAGFSDLVTQVADLLGELL